MITRLNLKTLFAHRLGAPWPRGPACDGSADIHYDKARGLRSDPRMPTYCPRHRRVPAQRFPFPLRRFSFSARGRLVTRVVDPLSAPGAYFPPQPPWAAPSPRLREASRGGAVPFARGIPTRAPRRRREGLYKTQPSGLSYPPAAPGSAPALHPRRSVKRRGIDPSACPIAHLNLGPAA